MMPEMHIRYFPTKEEMNFSEERLDQLNYWKAQNEMEELMDDEEL